MEEAKVVLKQNKQRLKNKDNVQEALQKHKKYFSDVFYTSTENHLKVMDQISNDCLKFDKTDISLKSKCEDHCREWDSLCNLIDSYLLELKQLPERWGQYNIRLQQFSKDVSKMEQLMVEMQKESPSADEYQNLYMEFQAVMEKLRANIQADITTGEQLLATNDAPSFVAEKTAELNGKWTKTIREGEEKYQKLIDCI